MKTKIRFISFLIIGCLTINNQDCFGQSQHQEVGEVKAHISALLKSKLLFCGPLKNNLYDIWCNQKNIEVFEDRIEFKKNKNQIKVIKFSDLLNYKITYEDYENISFVIIGDYRFQFYDPDKKNGSLLFNDFNFFQFGGNLKMYNDEIVLFEPIAVKYRDLKVKPIITEEQRKFIVQANGFNEEKMYDKAIVLYNKAIEIDQTSYPAAYSNLALLHALTNQYYAAIYYMKKYLMLDPNTDDARAAQDKIYLWESKIEQYVNH